MKRIELSDMTQKIRRNLVASSFIMLVIVLANLKISKISAGGLQLEGFSTSVALVTLMVFSAYHLLAFVIHAFEEYRFWRNEITSTGRSLDGQHVIDLALVLKEASEALENVLSRPGANSSMQAVFGSSDIQNLKDVRTGVLKYAKSYRIFPWITGFRFWVWDVLISVAPAILSLYLGYRKLEELGSI